MVKITITWLPEFQMLSVSTGEHSLYLMDIGQAHLSGIFVMSLCFAAPTSQVMYTIIIILVYLTPDVGATKHGLITKRDFSHDSMLCCSHIWSYVLG